MSVATLGNLVEISVGFAFKSAEFSHTPTHLRLLRGDNIGQGVVRWDSVRYFPSIPTELDHLLLAEGDVVVAMDRPWVAAGLKFAVIRSSDLPCVLVQRVARLRSRPGLDQRFLGYLIADQGFVSHVLSVQTGSTIPHISSGQIGEFRIMNHPGFDAPSGYWVPTVSLDLWAA